MERYASRKFILALITLLVSTWVLFEHLLDASAFKAIVIGTVGAYIMGNVTQKVVDKKDQSDS